MDPLINEIKLPEGYIFKDENGNIINATKIVLEKKEKEYPKTYEECDKELGYHQVLPRGNFLVYKGTLLSNLLHLLICRDAYWKLAGEKMGLGKLWNPNWNTSDPKYVLACANNRIEKRWETTYSKVLAFPTPEIRDLFYDNFKELIEQCKELL